MALSCSGFLTHSPLRSPNGLCLSPKHHSCTASESEPLVFDSDCISDSTWFLLRDDGTLQHACSEMCVWPLNSSGVPTEWSPVGLSSYACDDHTQRLDLYYALKAIKRNQETVIMGTQRLFSSVK